MQNFTWKTFTHKSKYEGFIYRPKNYSRFVRIAKIDNVAIKYQIAAFIVRKNISRVKVSIKTNLFFLNTILQTNVVRKLTLRKGQNRIENAAKASEASWNFWNQQESIGIIVQLILKSRILATRECLRPSIIWVWRHAHESAWERSVNKLARNHGSNRSS